MDTDKDTAETSAVPPETAGEPRRPDARARWRLETIVPTLAVVAVSVTAVITAVMVSRNGSPIVQQAASVSRQSVVTAPPLNLAPPTPAEAPAQSGPSPAASNAMGATAACRNCGVVQMVVAVHEYGQPKPSSYQMHIRMDDGSIRTVEQRGALAAGSRVMVEGKAVRPLPAPQEPRLLPGGG
jgi:hypothetical protein